MNPGFLLAHFDQISAAPDAIPKLRGFILDLAVRGKLVEQNPTDEPAAQLMNRIAATKSKLGKSAGVVRVDAIGAEDAPFKIPSSWVWVRLAEICSKTGSGSTPRGGKSVYQADGVPFLRSQNVYDNGLRLDDVAYISPQTHQKMSGTAVEPGDLLLNITGGSIGRCCSIPAIFGQANVSQHVAIIRMAIGDLQGYLHQLILSPYFQSFVFSEQTGAGRGGLPKNRMDRIPVALPPLAEQYRIVATINQLMALCDRLEVVRGERESQRDRLIAASHYHLNNSANVEGFRKHSHFCLNHFPRLTTRPEHIPALRRTILSLAVRGQLVHQNPSDEPASELLKRIQVEKSRLTEDGNIKKDKRTWEGLPKDPPHELPVTWIWTCLQDVFEISRGGSPRPAGDPRYFGGPIPWITVREITKDGEKYLTSTEGGLTEEGATRSRFIESGDLLLTNSGATLGVPKISRIKACMNDGVALLRLFHSVPLNEFAYLYLHSQTDAFRRVNQGMGQPNLNTPIIAGWFFPLPPLAEQRRIVAKVDELMALCDRLEAQLATVETETSRLLESVLHHALKETAERVVPSEVPTFVGAVSSLR